MADEVTPGFSKTGGDTMLRMSLALHGLLTSSELTLQELGDVEAALEQETAAGTGNGSPGDPLIIASMLKEMVVTWVSDLQKVQKLLPEASGADHLAVFQDLITSRRAINSLTQSEYPRVEKARGAGLEGQGLCKHFCDHHPEVVDPRLWRNLPQELVERVFANLPLHNIVELRNCSKAWYTMSMSLNFGEVCSERHPKLFGLLGWDYTRNPPCLKVRLYDMERKEWLSVPLAGFPEPVARGDSESEADDVSTLKVYQGAKYACDGGLVCVVPGNLSTCYPILVCNPLTGIWKTLPLAPVEYFNNKETFMVQLVMEDDKKGYRVLVVSRESNGEALLESAYCYKSETNSWSIMDSGFVYGTDGLGPLVFDCTRRKVFNHEDCDIFLEIHRDCNYLQCSVARDRVYVLFQADDLGRECDYLVSECTWDHTISDLRQLNVFRSPVLADNRTPVCRLWLYSSRNFILFFLDFSEEYENLSKVVGLYDVSAKRWDSPPWLAYDSETLVKMSMCELRWDITP